MEISNIILPFKVTGGSAAMEPFAGVPTPWEEVIIRLISAEAEAEAWLSLAIMLRMKKC